MAFGSILNQETQGAVPTGLIAMWSGASTNIPNGWALCDGNNNTPDLRDKFIVGAGNAYQVGNTGGADTVALTVNEMPSHNHSLSSTRTSSAGSHTHDFIGTSDTSRMIINRSNIGAQSPSRQGLTSYYSDKDDGDIEIKSAGSHTHTLSGTVSNTGSGNAHENRPPYYALCYIMKT